MMKMKYKSWKDISISTYYQVVSIVGDTTTTKDEKNIKLVSLMTGRSEEEVALLPAFELSGLVGQLDWIYTFTFNQKHCPRRLKVGGKKFRVVLEPTKLTTAQYLDFKTFYSYKDLKTYYGNILACFIIPLEAKGYGDSYDPLDLAKFLYENVTIQEANTLMFFFLKKLDLSIRITLTYLDYLLKKAVKKDPENLNLRISLEKLREQVKRIPGHLLLT